MNRKELDQHYHSLLTDLEEISSSNDNIPEEKSIIVFTSEWVKIFLVGNVVNQQISLQVEVYSGFSQIDENKLHLALRKYIKMLQYLLRLNANGFTLDIVVEEGIWLAIKNLKSEPSEELQNLLFQFLEEKK